MKLDLIDVVAPPILVIGFLLLGWGAARSINMGKPLTPIQRIVLIYVALFLLGMFYSMVAANFFHMRDSSWIALTIMWAGVLSYGAWRRHKRTTPSSRAPTVPSRPLTTVLAEGLPVVGLLVFLIASVIAWSVWAEGGARLWVPLLCTAGVAVMVFISRRNRRATVIMALRGLLAMGAVGALSHPTGPAFITVGFIGLFLVLLEKFWKERQAPPRDQQIQTLFDGDKPAPTTKSH